MKSTNAYWLALLVAAAALGQEDRGRIEELPEAAKGVDVEEKLGAMLPMDAVFLDSDGKATTLAQCFIALK